LHDYFGNKSNKGGIPPSVLAIRKEGELVILLSWPFYPVVLLETKTVMDKYTDGILQKYEIK
jgi:hypothetical protein